MDRLEIISLSITLLLYFCTVMCGLWIQYSGEEIEPSSISFHMWTALLALAASGVTFYLLAR